MTLHRTIGLRALYVWGAPLITDGGPGLLGTDPLVSTRLRMGGGGGGVEAIDPLTHPHAPETNLD